MANDAYIHLNDVVISFEIIMKIFVVNLKIMLHTLQDQRYFINKYNIKLKMQIKQSSFNIQVKFNSIATWQIKLLVFVYG